ncbi:hypothetical protein SAMN04488084_101232 [Pedobacter antarcticus]|uniref:Uncharacterized protein n=1 Tax=Pedobacter antarcticus TaxID=34086 RepID=A0A1I2AFF0_9SPHI|nr:hypothetical protein SAMN04488084_101232 [Pedobacter antarcticus]SFE42744.1 hypothetical protein SAMN03003324_00437 [Pedobacter antarcticus]
MCRFNNLKAFQFRFAILDKFYRLGIVNIFSDLKMTKFIGLSFDLLAENFRKSYLTDE